MQLSSPPLEVDVVVEIDVEVVVLVVALLVTTVVPLVVPPPLPPVVVSVTVLPQPEAHATTAVSVIETPKAQACVRIVRLSSLRMIFRRLRRGKRFPYETISLSGVACEPILSALKDSPHARSCSTWMVSWSTPSPSGSRSSARLPRLAAVTGPPRTPPRASAAARRTRSAP
jgi:hypothetical protein